MPRRRLYKLSLAAFVVLTVVWIGSCWVSVEYSTGTATVGVGKGALIVTDTTRMGFALPAGFSCRISNWTMGLFPLWLSGIWVIPLWIPLAIASIPMFIIRDRSRRIPPGHCKTCRYDLTGNISGVCPECGIGTGDG